MTTLRDDGLEKVLLGLTSIEEILPGRRLTRVGQPICAVPPNGSRAPADRPTFAMRCRSDVSRSTPGNGDRSTGERQLGRQAGVRRSHGPNSNGTASAPAPADANPFAPAPTVLPGGATGPTIAPSMSPDPTVGTRPPAFAEPVAAGAPPHSPVPRSRRACGPDEPAAGHDRRDADGRSLRWLRPRRQPPRPQRRPAAQTPRRRGRRLVAAPRRTRAPKTDAHRPADCASSSAVRPTCTSPSAPPMLRINGRWLP